ncbi:MAG: ABC transporter substrate-binding protein [Alphaproteobacteria bacterium]|nr:ABC transporter substrate-binding protein [Alphaproteobacteria bacterium]
MRYIAAIVLALALATPATMARADSHIDASVNFIDQLANQAIGSLTDKSITAEKRRDEFRKLFRDGFAVNGIARFVAGRYWRKASDAERTEYLSLFEDVIVNTWADRFSLYSGQKFEVRGGIDATPEKSKQNVALVKSWFFTSLTSSVQIEWRVASKDDLFKIIDVKLEGISMATTQRDEFNSVVSKSGRTLSSLIKELRTRRDG